VWTKPDGRLAGVAAATGAGQLIIQIAGFWRTCMVPRCSRAGLSSAAAGITMHPMEMAAQLDSEIAAAAAEVARLDELRDEAVRGLERLQAERARLCASSGLSAESCGWSAERKLEVFAGLFRGRWEIA
jgi:hypothetical protein